MIQIEEPQHHKQQQEDFAAKKAHQGKRVLQCDIHHRVFFFFFCSGSVTTFKTKNISIFIFKQNTEYRIQNKKMSLISFFLTHFPFAVFTIYTKQL